MAIAGATNTISGSIKWTGLGSDTDFGAVVDAMIATERRVITKQETWKSQWQEKLEAINNLDVRLGAVKQAAQDYGTRDKLLSRKGTSSDEKVVTISNTSTAATGSYSVEVAEKTNEIKSSRTYKEGEDIGMNFATNDKGQPVDKNGKVLTVRAWDVENVLSLLAYKLPAGTAWPVKYNEAGSNFLDANGDVVALWDRDYNAIEDTANNHLFSLSSDAWIAETALANVAAKTGASLPVRYVPSSGIFYDSANNAVAQVNLATDEVHAYGAPTDVLFTLGADGISTTWETDSALAILTQRLAGNTPPPTGQITFNETTNEFFDSSAPTPVLVAKLDPATREIYDPADRNNVYHYMSRHNMTNWGDPNIIKFLEEHTDMPEGATRPFTFNQATSQYVTADGNVAADLDTVMGVITLPGSGQVLLALDAGGNVTDTDGKPVISSDTSRHYYGPMTFTMNGKTLELAYDPDYDPATDGIQPYKFSGKCSMEELEQIINASIADPGYTGPNIKAEIVFDKQREETITNADGTTSKVKVNHNRLRIIGLDAGAENSIQISDPTNLNMDQNSIDAPQKTQWVGSNTEPVLSADSKYTGHVNKTITFVVSEGGTLGEDEIIISWADTENNAGNFTIEPDDWDSLNGCLKKDVEIFQGIKVNFNRGTLGNGTELQKSNAFSIDCQAPTVQKAADSGLAQSDKWVHRGFPDLTSPVNKGSGKFDFSYAGVEYSIPVRDGTTLSGLADAINSSNKNPGVIASVLNDGMGTATSYKLVLTAAHPGSEHEIRILDTTKISEMSMRPEDFEHARVATNSMCRIDGYPSDGVTWIQRPSNEVGDVLNGTVLELQSTGKATVNIVNDVADMAKKITSIVEAINMAVSYIQEQTRYAGGKFTINVLKDGTIQRTTEGGDASGVMIGNYGFQISNSEIKRLMSSQIFTREEYIHALDEKKEKEGLLPIEEQEKLYQSYLEENGLIYTRLSDIGIAFNATATTDYAKGGSRAGAYVIEQSKLNEALRKNPEAVIKLLTFKPDDTFPVKEKYQDEDPRPTLGGGVLTKMFYSMSDLTRASDVHDKKTGEVIQSAKGIMRVLSENYSNIISGIDEKIAREEKRIGLKQQRLEEKFARLDLLLAQLNQQSEKVKAEIDKLNQ